MRSLLASIATRLSRFRYVLAIAAVVACAHRAATETDGGLDGTLYTPPDLSGPIACGELTCGSGQICSDYESNGPGGSNDPIDNYSCVTPSPTCELRACSGACSQYAGSDCCPDCIANLCQSPVDGYDGARSITCDAF